VLAHYARHFQTASRCRRRFCTKVLAAASSARGTITDVLSASLLDHSGYRIGPTMRAAAK